MNGNLIYRLALIRLIVSIMCTCRKPLFNSSSNLWISSAVFILVIQGVTFYNKAFSIKKMSKKEETSIMPTTMEHWSNFER
jgi:hypothetical protein